jgi:hypothetical protein
MPRIAQIPPGERPVRTFRVKNFEKFQHYKDRSPPWIKFYNDLLDDYDFGQLPDASKWHLVAIWLLASRYNNEIPFDQTWVSRRINATEKVDLKALEQIGFIILNHGLNGHASDVLAECKQNAMPERETEREKIDIGQGKKDFEIFYQAYPRHTARAAAEKAFARAIKKTTLEILLAAVERQKPAWTDPQFIPHPATWLNQGRWADELPIADDWRKAIV